MLRKRKTLRLSFALAIGLVTIFVLILPLAVKNTCRLGPRYEERTINTDYKPADHQNAAEGAKNTLPLKQSNSSQTDKSPNSSYLKNFDVLGFCQEAKITDIALVYFTACLVIVGWFGIRSNERAIRDMERAVIFLGPVQPSVTGAKTVSPISLENYGRSVGVVKEIYVETSITEPTGKPVFNKTVGVSKPRDDGFPPSAPRKPTDRPPLFDWWEFPHTGEHYVFGYVRYIDIFRIQHHSLFCNKIDPATHRVTIAGPPDWNDWD